MVGMERNADVVEMGSYAPLLVNANWVTWLPDMIVFDNHRVYGIPSYWVQQMFAQHQGTHSLAVKVGARLLPCTVLRCAGVLVQQWQR